MIGRGKVFPNEVLIEYGGRTVRKRTWQRKLFHAKCRKGAEKPGMPFEDLPVVPGYFARKTLGSAIDGRASTAQTGPYFVGRSAIQASISLRTHATERAPI